MHVEGMEDIQVDIRGVRDHSYGMRNLFSDHPDLVKMKLRYRFV